MYKIAVTMNGDIYETETKDLKKSLSKFKPEDVHTEVYVSITKGVGSFIRKLSLPKAKTIFRDEEQLDLFLTNLLF